MIKGKRLYIIIGALVLLVVLIALKFVLFPFTPSRLPKNLTDVPKPLLTITTGKGQLNHPLSVAVSSSGKLYVSDSGSNQVQVFKNDGKFLFAFGQSGKGEGQFDTPYGLAFMPDGSVLVSDMLNNRIQQFSQDGKFLKEFLPGSKGIKPGLLMVDNQEVYVSDLASNQVVVLNLQGETLRQYRGEMTFPQGLANMNNKLYVADAGHNQVRVYSKEGEQNTERIIETKESFQLLRGLGVDNLDRILVVDSLKSQVLLMSENGKIFGSLGTPGSGNGQFQFPAGIALDRYGKIYIADWGNNRIQVWGY